MSQNNWYLLNVCNVNRKLIGLFIADQRTAINIGIENKKLLPILQFDSKSPSHNLENKTFSVLTPWYCCPRGNRYEWITYSFQILIISTEALHSRVLNFLCCVNTSLSLSQFPKLRNACNLRKILLRGLKVIWIQATQY